MPRQCLAAFQFCVWDSTTFSISALQAAAPRTFSKLNVTENGHGKWGKKKKTTFDPLGCPVLAALDLCPAFQEMVSSLKLFEQP